MSKEKTSSLKRSIKIGIIHFFIVFLLGFGAMYILYNRWLQTDAHLYPGLKGLFDYKASSWGDAICLPAIVGAGVAFKSYFKTGIENKKAKWIPRIFCFIGLAAGFLMQCKWVLSDTTILNWSIPVQHHFNTAGYWHGAFFVIVSAAISYIAGYVCIIDWNLGPRHKKNTSILENPADISFYSICQFIIWFAGLLFLHFHYIDDYAPDFAEWKIIGCVSAVGIIIVLGFKLFINKTSRKLVYYGPAIFAIILSAEVALLNVLGWPQCEQLFLICGLLCSATYVYNSKNKLKMICFFLVYVFYECLCQIKMTHYVALGNWILFYTFAGACLLVPICITLIDIVFIEKGRNFAENKEKTIAKFCIYSFIMNMVPLLLSHSQSETVRQIIGDISVFFKSNVASFVLFFMLHYYIKTTFKHIQTIEYNSSEKVEEVERIKYSQYIIYGFAYIAAIVLLWNSLKLKMDTFPLNWFYSAAIVILIIAAVCIFGIKTSSVKRSSVFMYIAYLAMIIFLLVTRATIPVSPTESFLWGNAFMTIYVVCNMTIIIVLSLLYNVFLLRQKNIQAENIGYIIAVGLLSSICFGLASYHLFLYRTVSHAIQLTVITLVSFCLLPYRYSKVLNPAGNVGIIDKQTARQGVIQDGFLFGIVANANTIMSMAILDRLFMNDEFLWQEAVGIFIAYSVGLYPLCHYCLKNIDKHKKEMQAKLERMAVDKTEKIILTEQYRNLETWLTAQKALASLLSFPYSLCYYIYEWIKPSDEPKTEKENGVSAETNKAQEQGNNI